MGHFRPKTAARKVRFGGGNGKARNEHMPSGLHSKAQRRSPAQRAHDDGRRLVCGDRSGRTSAPTSRQAVQTIRRHKERTGISSGSPSAFMTTLRLRSPPRVPIWAAKDDHYDHHVWLWLRLGAPPSRGARIARLDALATLLDTALVIPGTGVRFGLDALIGLFPVVGDIITTALSLFIVHEAYQLGAPGHVIARMLGNVVLDGVFGAVPLVGDAFDVLWRANRRNVRLLQEWLHHERWR